MHGLFFYIGLGAGLAAAAGVRPFAAALLAGALASWKALGVTFQTTTRTDYKVLGGVVHGVRTTSGYHFLDAGWWLIVMAALLLVSYLLQAWLGSQKLEEGTLGSAIGGIGIGIGALLFGGTLAAHSDAAWPGLIGGVLCAGLAQLAVRPLMNRVRGRLTDRVARDALTLYADLLAVLITILTALLHPLGYVAVVALAWLALASRRRSGERYAGLRILRH